MSTTTADEIRLASWWGRTSADVRSIHCAQNGWREAVWKRNRRGKWYEAEATLRRVVGYDWSNPIDQALPRPVLGEPMRVK